PHFLLREQGEAVDDPPLLTPHWAQRMLEPHPDLQLSDSRYGSKVGAKDVFPEFEYLEALLPRQPRRRRRAFASFVHLAGVALRSWCPNNVASLDLVLLCHFASLLLGTGREGGACLPMSGQRDGRRDAHTSGLCKLLALWWEGMSTLRIKGESIGHAED